MVCVKCKDWHPPRLMPPLAQPHANRFLNFNAGTGPVLDFIGHCGKRIEGIHFYLVGQLGNRGKSLHTLPVECLRQARDDQYKAMLPLLLPFLKTQNLF